MNIDEQRRMILSNMGNTKSFLNIVSNSQFNAPSYPNQSLMGAAYSKDRTKFIMLSNGVSGTTPSNQKRLYCYTNSNPIGIAESPSDLTYVGLSNDLAFEISGVRQQVGTGIHWDSDLGKIWARVGATAKTIAEYDFDFSTFTATFVQLKDLTYAFDGGNFYFNNDYSELYTCQSSGSNNYAKYTLSAAGDISTATLSAVKTGVPFTNEPIFFESGTSAVFSYFNGGSSQNDLRKTQLATAYDIDSFISGNGYQQPFYRSIGGYRVTAQLPIIASLGLRKINYFSAGSTSGGRIGVGTFDIPLDFRGNGNGLGGVYVGTTLIT